MIRKHLRWLASLLPLQRQAHFVAWLLPNRYWYRGALAICRFQGWLNGLLGGNRVLTEAVMLDHWLWELTAIGQFPIPWVLKGEDVVAAADSKIGTVYCWIHEPLVDFPMRPLAELGQKEGVVIADRGRIVDGRYPIVGLAKGVPAIPVDGFTLVRAIRSLMDGLPVVCLADEYLGGPLQPFVLQLAGRAGARVVFQWAIMRPDGTIEVTFVNAPRPYCETTDAIHENLSFLRVAQVRMLSQLGLSTEELLDPGIPAQDLQ